jgi:hypothetical protein
MADFKPIFELSGPEPASIEAAEEAWLAKRHLRALAVFHEGLGRVVLCEDGWPLEEVRGMVPGHAGTDGFSLEHVDHEPQPDGAYVGVVRLVDDGPSDWPGGREVVPVFAEVRRATKEEWARHLRDEWPWEVGR